MPEGSSQHQTHFYIELSGQETPPELQQALQQIQVDSSLHLPDVAMLILLDNETKWADDASLMPGKTLKIKSKTEDGENTIFDGEIVELEPSFEGSGQKVTVRAFDRLHRLTRGRYVRTFVQMTDSDVMQKIIREVGLKADITASSEVYDHIFQPNQSNLEFLQARAAALGRYLYAEGETIHCAPPVDDPALELELHAGLTAFFPRLSTSAQVAEVQVRGWNVRDKQEVLGKATKGTTAPKTGVAESGGDLASAAHSVTAKYLVNEPVVRTQSAADKLAQAVIDRFEGQKIEAHGSASGNPKLLAGSKIKISGNTTTTKIQNAASAPRVPVIISATTLKPSVNANRAMREELLLCTSKYKVNGKVHTTNSAKKLRLTNVEAGLGPCGKNVKSK